MAIVKVSERLLYDNRLAPKSEKRGKINTIESEHMLRGG